MDKSKNYLINFIHKIINASLENNKTVHTRFPPEPNGYLHIGHTKSICLNFNIAKYYNGICNLRFDDTNPSEESLEYINSIQYDIYWLGFSWGDKIYYASDYFNKLYNYAIELIKKKLAYVDQLSTSEIKNYRGTLIKSGVNSPHRDNSVEKNLMLFQKMYNGKFNEGNACLRAKIDMSSKFMIMRDPVLYRIKFIKHYRTKNKWCIYPTYDFAHCISDALENITHSLCTLEFLNNRKLYEWILQNISIKSYPKQYEFSRLNLEYTVMSKRKINILIKNKIVNGWDDPRLSTISGLRRKGYTSSSIREFCNCIGVTKQDNNIEISMLESCLRKELNFNAPRVMAVINPIMIIINSLPKGYIQSINVLNHPKRPEMGTHNIIFSREIYIDKSDFTDKNIHNYKRLILGQKVKLRHAYVIKAEYIKVNDQGLNTIICSHDPNTMNNLFNKNEVKGVIHWVSATYSLKAEFRFYERLFNVKKITEDNMFSSINKNSLIIHKGFIEPSVILTAKLGIIFQFEREGYFCLDYRLSKKFLVFNRTVNLRNLIDF